MTQRCPRIRCSSSMALWSLCTVGCVLTVVIPSPAIENAIQIIVCTALTTIATRSLARSEARSDEMIDAAVDAALKMAMAWTIHVPTAPETVARSAHEESLAQVVILPRPRRAAHARRGRL